MRQTPCKRVGTTSKVLSSDKYIRSNHLSLSVFAVPVFLTVHMISKVSPEKAISDVLRFRTSRSANGERITVNTSDLPVLFSSEDSCK